MHWAKENHPARPCHTTILSWKSDTNPHRFQFFCDKHVTSTQMFNSPCKCWQMSCKLAIDNHHWPLKKSTPPKRFVLNSHPTFVNAQSCCSFLDGEKDVCVEVPTQNSIDNFNIPVESNPPPKHTKPTKVQERIASKKKEKTNATRKTGRQLGIQKEKMLNRNGPEATVCDNDCFKQSCALGAVGPCL